MKIAIIQALLILISLSVAKAAEKSILKCSEIPIKGYSTIDIVSEHLNGMPYIVTYLVKENGKRVAVESYPDKKAEGLNGIKKPSFHVFKAPNSTLEWQLINYNNAFPAATDSWDLVRIGGPALSAEEAKKYPTANDPHSGNKINKTAFYNMKCKTPISNDDGLSNAEEESRVLNDKRKEKERLSIEKEDGPVQKGNLSL